MYAFIGSAGKKPLLVESGVVGHSMYFMNRCIQAVGLCPRLATRTPDVKS